MVEEEEEEEEEEVEEKCNGGGEGGGGGGGGGGVGSGKEKQEAYTRPDPFCCHTFTVPAGESGVTMTTTAMEEEKEEVMVVMGLRNNTEHWVCDKDYIPTVREYSEGW
ncbi:hypothetical protein Pmani_027243 [Petrolisthes manimaculis]|uniref:Uncharacterized protein n=1 Tax=Petrolisthes manimaculis TaxID=1843537 RepID=A0AAE1TWN7_9EUCA|nr:hypothetical protein Pmani_027243 [Petrolisthes manimaculis]